MTTFQLKHLFFSTPRGYTIIVIDISEKIPRFLFYLLLTFWKSPHSVVFFLFLGGEAFLTGCHYCFFFYSYKYPKEQKKRKKNCHMVFIFIVVTFNVVQWIE